MKKLILDLRGNGGGILDDAVNIADEFLDEPKLILYTQGANSKRRDYRTKRPGLFEEGPLVILVDEFSASASEVLAGAVQDWDRGTVVGRRSFGKGLVQEPFDLKNGGQLRLTVSRYYTPAGRNIQKPYNKGRDVYEEELINRVHNGEMIREDTSTPKGPVYNTLKKKRIVYGGGGITPDVFVPYDTGSFSKEVSRLFYEQTFGKFVYTYFLQHKEELKKYKSADDFASNFKPGEEAWQNLRQLASKDSISLNHLTEKEKAEIEKRMKAYLARQIWRMEGYYVVSNKTDPVVLKAIETLQKQ
jgi:carboxyl-terminal processing protease